MLRIKLFQNIHDIIWELSIIKGHKILKNWTNKYIVTFSKIDHIVGKHSIGTRTVNYSHVFYGTISG